MTHVNQSKLKKIIIWDVFDYFGGGQRLAIEVGEALKDIYDVNFLLPDRKELSEAFRQKGFSIDYYAYTRLSRGKKSYTDILKFICSLPLGFLSSFFAIRKIKPGLIYSNAAPTFIFSSVIGALLNIPIIWHVHNNFEDKKTVNILRIFGKLKSVKKIVCDSKALETQFPLIREKTLSISPCIHLKEYQNIKNDSNLRKILDISDNTHIILQIGWIMKSKGQHILIDAAKRVYEKRRDTCFLFIGNSLNGEEEYLNELKGNIEEYQLNGVVRLLGFFSDVRPFLIDAFVNVIASFEGFSIAMLEAAAFNVPTIGPDVGGPSVTIEDRVNGLLYKFQDSKDLADKILYLLKEKDIYERMRKNTTEFVEKYTMEQYHIKIKNLIDQVLNSKDGHRRKEF